MTDNNISKTSTRELAGEMARRLALRLVPSARARDEYARFERGIMAQLPTLRPDQQAIADDPARFVVLNAGRRWGKSLLMRHIIVPRLLRGERWWYTYPTFGSPGARDTWHWFETAFQPLRDAGLAYVNRSQRLIRLSNGGQFEVIGLEKADNLRGPGLDGVVMDEAAFTRDDVWTLRLMPMLIGRESRTRAYFASTPFGRNWFWDVYQMGLDPLRADWASYHRSSFERVALRDEYDMIRDAVNERVFAQEYLAEFLEDSGTVFRGVSAAATVARGQYEPVAGGRYVMGVDWGRDNDYTVMSVVDADNGRMVDMMRVREVGYHLQRGHLVTLFRKWRPVAIWAEANSIGAPNIEELQREGLPVRPFQTTAKSKTPLVESLVLAIERGELAILKDEVLKSELTAYTMERLPGGGWRYNAPSGGHDDTVISLALAWHGVSAGGSLVLW